MKTLQSKKFFEIARISGKPRLLQVILAMAYFLCLVGCSSEPPPSPPPPTAVFSHPLQRTVVEWDQYPARLESPQTVSLSARVSGIIERAPFQEGSLVKQGDVLFELDDRSFKAAYASSEAEVARARSQVSIAESRFNRFSKLQGTRAISADDFDEAVANLRQAKANLLAAEAARDNAQLNLEWTKVTAPIDGRISRKNVTEGNQVNGGAGQATQLTTITSVDPMYCLASVSERNLVRYRKLLEAKRKEGQSQFQIPAAIQLEGSTGFDYTGTVNFIDNQVNPATGTIDVRATLENPDGILTSGQFARLRIQGSDNYPALLVPDVALGTDQNSKFVLVIGEDETLEYRPVVPGMLFGDMRAITKGITANDRVVVTGVQQLRPKTKVAPTERPLETKLFEASLLLNPSVQTDVAANQSGAAK